MHLYTCNECPDHAFYTNFVPDYEEGPYCPCCGRSDLVQYRGEVKLVEVPNVKTA